LTASGLQNKSFKNQPMKKNFQRSPHMNKRLTLVGSLLAVCLGLFTALPAKAASLQPVTNWIPSGVPTNVSMYVYSISY
jgi:hypothetical protein